jgi:hypothetical protein
MAASEEFDQQILAEETGTSGEQNVHGLSQAASSASVGTCLPVVPGDSWR